MRCASELSTPRQLTPTSAPSESPNAVAQVEREGSAVLIRGTSGNDHLAFVAAASPNGTHTIVLNDTPYEFPATEVNVIRFDGRLGKDTALLIGSADSEQLEASFNWASLQSPTYVVEVTSTEIMTFEGGEGTATDTAELIDSVLDDTLLGTGELVRLAPTVSRWNCTISKISSRARAMAETIASPLRQPPTTCSRLRDSGRTFSSEAVLQAKVHPLNPIVTGPQLKFRTPQASWCFRWQLGHTTVNLITRPGCFAPVHECVTELKSQLASDITAQRYSHFRDDREGVLRVAAHVGLLSQQSTGEHGRAGSGDRGGRAAVDEHFRVSAAQTDLAHQVE